MENESFAAGAGTAKPFDTAGAAGAAALKPAAIEGAGAVAAEAAGNENETNGLESVVDAEADVVLDVRPVKFKNGDGFVAAPAPAAASEVRPAKGFGLAPASAPDEAAGRENEPNPAESFGPELSIDGLQIIN